jgi:hypothetical protein
VVPIAAMALFGGAYLNKKYALIVPLLALFISDFFLGFHASMLLVYSSFFLTGFLGLYLSKHRSATNIFAASLLSSLIFYLLTNFNFWYATSLYPKTFEGMMQSYVAALPFFKNTILGDLFYNGIFFGSYALMRSFFKKSVLSPKERPA